MGFALVLSPIVFALLAPEGAIVILTALGLELSLLVLLSERRRPQIVWPEVAPILVAAAPGTVCGVLVLRALSKPVLQIAVGVLVVAAALMRLRTARRSVGTTNGSARLALGFAAGALTTSAGISGPPIALWLSGRNLAPGQVRDSLSGAFLAIGVIAAIVLVPILPHAHLHAPLILAGIACVIAGHAVGSRLFVRLHARVYETLLLVVILAAGVASVVAGVVGLGS
jgi:uncharacterized membrane protein YfcA